jgi:membrane-bound lytic murein transglycosylase MltF
MRESPRARPQHTLAGMSDRWLLLLILLAGCGPTGELSVVDVAHASSLGGGSPEVIGSTEIRTGDLREMRKDRRIRALVVWNRTGFFIDRGRPRGFEVELLQAYEKTLNAGIDRTKRKVNVVYLPVPTEELLPALREGRGDLVAAGMTATSERRKLVAFTEPYLRDVNEIVVMNRTAPALERIEGLSGRSVHVVRGTSHVEHLTALSRHLVTQGHRPIEIVEVDGRLDPEDVLEMVHAGVFELTVADAHVAKLWSRVLNQLVLREELVVHDRGVIAWAVRKESPELRKSLNAFLAEHRKGTLIGNVLFKRYYGNTTWIHNPLEPKDRARFERYRALIRRYAERYGFDWLQIAAQAYQESGLDPQRVSRAGAVGLMQVLPSTAGDRNVAIPDVKDDENNVHAGVKYMAFLRDRYLSGPSITPQAQFDLTLAAYNMGPARLNRVRHEAARRGLDQNRWFNHVELVALERVGREPVRYVANVNKYYVAYRLAERRRLEKEEERRRIRAASSESGG